MRVRDVMTHDVLTIGPEAPLKEVARLLVEHRISGLPVCDAEGKVLGVVSEGDILYKEHDPGEAHVGGALGWLIDGAANHAGLAKAGALTARKAMTAPAITVPPHTAVAEAARIMCERGINRLPVVADETLVGIVTRTDLVRAFTQSDEQIAAELRDDVLERTLWVEPGTIGVTVVNGVAVLSGRLHAKSAVDLLERLAARVPGVVTVQSTVMWDVDDTTRRSRHALHAAR